MVISDYQRRQFFGTTNDNYRTPHGDIFKKLACDYCLFRRVIPQQQKQGVGS